MPLLQVHWQWIKNGETVKTQFVSQRNIRSHKQMRAWAREVKRKHPPPAGAVFMVCNKSSPHFVMTTE